MDLLAPMDQAVQTRDAHEAPPAQLKEIFKRYQKLSMGDLNFDLDVIDYSRPLLLDGAELVVSISSSHLRASFHSFAPEVDLDFAALQDLPVYGHRRLPGLFIIPSLLPSSIQKAMLSRILHRDLSNPRHKTNVHLHYDVPYPGLVKEGPLQVMDQKAREGHSFFSYSPVSDVIFPPRDPAVHQPLSIVKFMRKSLRWITLGGQYDWTNKVYPKDRPPEFPSDVGQLLEGLFPGMKAQAAIVNLYSPGDTLSLHRDVSEESDKGLASISFGCECLFAIGHGQQSNGLVIRLRSGDGLFMSKGARFAWHGVPRIIPDTCPEYLKSWPAESGQYEDWRGWMSTKRINLNVRQMYD